MNDGITDFVKKIVIGIVILIFLVILLTMGNIAMFISVFSWLQTKIHEVSGLDSMLCKAIGAFVMALIVTLPLGAIALSLTPIPQKNKGLYRGIIFVGVAVFFLFTYFGGKNVYFSPKNGTPVKYYVEYPNGQIKIFSEPGNDPITGTKLKPVTPEIALKEQGIFPKPIIKPDMSNVYFDPKTGAAVQYYSEYPNGEIKFYQEPGNDPITGDRLRPVTRELILKAKGLLPKPEPIVVPSPPPTPAIPVQNTPPVESTPSSYNSTNSGSSNYSSGNSSSYSRSPSSSSYSSESNSRPSYQVGRKIENRSQEQSFSNSDYEPTRVLCSTTFQNRGGKTFLVSDSYSREVLRIGAYKTATLNLQPGTYYYREFNNSGLSSFVVPNQGSYSVNFIAQANHVRKSYRIINSRNR